MTGSVSTTRRRFTSMLSAAPLALAPALAANVDPHRGWLAEVDACIAEIDAIYAARPTMEEQNAAKPLVDAVYARQDAFLDRLTRTMAATKDGILIQVEMVMRDPFIFDDIPVADQLPLGDRHQDACIRSLHAAISKLA